MTNSQIHKSTKKTPQGKSNVNKEQQAAIAALAGPSMVVAGAGTGKTFVLTEKIKALILENNIKPENILALTFTEKAALEMEERVDKILPLGYFQTQITTFHSFAETLLKNWGIHIGIGGHFRILTEVEEIRFFTSHLKEFNLRYFYSTGNPGGFIGDVLAHFSRLRDENVSSETYSRFAKEALLKSQTDEEKMEAEKTLELSEIYARYETLKLQNNYLDFADLLFYLYKLLDTRPNVLAQIRAQFPYCLVDEFQDTNFIQYAIIKKLYPPALNPNLTVIGDDNQSIYRFRGATVENILNFIKDYPKAKTFVLQTNYRSFQEILDTSYQLIQNNNPDTLETRLGISKRLMAARGTEPKSIPRFIMASSGQEEAQRILEEINEARKQGYELNKMAILLRAKDHGRQILKLLEAEDIKYHFLGPDLLYEKRIVRDLVALLFFLNNANDSVSLFRLLSMDNFAVPSHDLWVLSNYAKRASLSLYEVIVQLNDTRDLPILAQVSEPGKEALLNLGKLIQNLVEAHLRYDKSALELLFSFLEGTGILKKLTNISSDAEAETLEAITQFFNKLKQMKGEYGEVTVAEAVNGINLELELGNVSVNNVLEESALREGINILTVHSSKGLQFKVVFLPSLSSDRFPGRNRSEKLPLPLGLTDKGATLLVDAHLAEERRLFYVALTRAEDKLVLSMALNYNDSKRAKKISPFVIETLGEDVVQEARAKLEKEKQSENPLSQSTTSDRQTTSLNLETKTEVSIPALKTHFSFSQMETFESCPLQYKYRYLLKIPEMDSAALSFGSSVHRALELFYTDLKAELSPSEETLLQYYQDNFIPYGFQGQAHKLRVFKHGQELLEKYFATWHDAHGEIVELEQPFTLKLNSGGKEFVLKGKIDRIDKHGDTYEIIDYKTGKMPSERELKKSLQLGLYALAVMDKNWLALPQNKIKLTYYYLDANERYSSMAGERDLAAVEEYVGLMIAQMNESTFLPKKGFQCAWCAFKAICPAWEK